MVSALWLFFHPAFAWFLYIHESVFVIKLNFCTGFCYVINEDCRFIFIISVNDEWLSRWLCVPCLVFIWNQNCPYWFCTCLSCLAVFVCLNYKVILSKVMSFLLLASAVCFLTDQFWFAWKYLEITGQHSIDSNILYNTFLVAYIYHGILWIHCFVAYMKCSTI